MLRVRVNWTAPVGGPYLSTFYRNVGTPVQADADDFASDVGDFLNAVDAVINLAVLWAVEASVDDLDAADGSLLNTFGVVPDSGNGGSTADALPAVAQMLVRWPTNAVINGRRVRGRTFLPGVSEAFSIGQKPLAAGILTVLTAAQALQASGLTIWHRPTGTPPSGGQPIEATGAAVWDQFAYLSSRRD